MTTQNANVHMDVLVPGGFKTSISFKISEPQQLTEFGKSLQACGIKPYVQQFGVQQSPSMETDAADKPPATEPQKAETKWKPAPAPTEPVPPTSSKPPAKSNGSKLEHKPMPDFIPQNVKEIVDIIVSADDKGGRVYTGMTEDSIEIKMDKQLKDQLHTVGHDISTWDISDPHLRDTIIVTTNTYKTIQQVQNPAGVWTWARQSVNLKEGDVICLRDEDAISYHEIKKNGRMSIELEGHSTIENTGTCYVCLTPPPVPMPDIPF